MDAASTLTTTLFTLLAAVMAVLAVRTILKALGPGYSGVVAAGAIVLAYLVIPAVLAEAGALDRYDPMPAPGLVLILVLAIATVVLALSRFGSRIATSLGIASLVGYQAFRIPVEWLLHRLYGEGVVPVQMTWSGRNFDVITGITALSLGMWLARTPSRPRGLLHAWNLLGFALLANVVAVAVLSAPVPFRTFMEGPPNLLPSTFPFIWLPTFLVQLALFGHLALFKELRRPDHGEVVRSASGAPAGRSPGRPESRP